MIAIERRERAALPEAELRARAAEAADTVAVGPPDKVADRGVIEALGASGLIAARWDRPDDLGGVALVEELAYRGLPATAVVVSLHVESVIAMLRQFARPGLNPLVAGARAGRDVGCVAASEPAGGSDLTAVETQAAPQPGGGWRIQGDKKFVTLGDQADFAVVVARLASGSGNGNRHGTAGRLGAFVVPRSGYEVVRTHRLVAASPLATSWIRLDAAVGPDHLLGRPGMGLAVLNWGLTKERLAIAALVVGVCRLALTLAVTHAVERRQFGVRLFDHQVVRLRLAELDAELAALRSDLMALAVGPSQPRRIAGLKVTAARFGERCVSECMHVFGGDGYVQDASPLGRLWRDIRLARIGGGTDEMMLELAAAGLVPDLALYRRHIPPTTD